jgi:hypothetical protein
MSRGWIGVDLDGTLAEYQGWHGPGIIGEPIPEMVAAVKMALAKGFEVRIFTARACPDRPIGELTVVHAAIREWTTKVFGRPLRATAVKDYEMAELWDDRCRQIEHNKGRFMSPSGVLGPSGPQQALPGMASHVKRKK